MEISFRHSNFDTSRHTEIRYDEDLTIEEMAEHLVRAKTKEGPGVAGFISDYYPFLSNLSIIENIILPLEYHEGIPTRAAAERVKKYWSRLGLEAVLMKRKENIRPIDLFKAMFVRAVSLDPELVFFINPEKFVPVRECERLVQLFREITEGRMSFWVGVHEGLKLDWDHDLEVRLHV